MRHLTKIQLLTLLGVIGVFSFATCTQVALGQQQCEANQFDKVWRGASGDDFGFSSAIDGDVAVVGAKYYDGVATATGAASVYRFDGSNWIYEQQLTASDAQYRDYFGCSVSVSGDYIAVGAYSSDDGGSASGSAYIFYYNGSSWSQQAKLLASDSYGGDMFGRSVFISGSYVVIGAPYCYTWDSGAAYVYTRSGTSWGTERKLTASGTKLLGYSVAISGSTIAVGAHRSEDNGDNSGSAFVFTRSGSTWTEQAKLLPSDGSPGHEFGESIAVSGDTVVVGAAEAGRAYVFEEPVGGWEDMAETSKFTGSSSNEFGKSVAISSDIVVVGIWGDDAGGTDAGSASVFVKPVTGWPSSMSRTVLLQASDAASGDRLGISAGISGSTVIVGAHRDDDDRGSAYFFHGLGDCQPNDTLDICDIKNGVSLDIDPHNGIPDECETDSDGDGVPDLADNCPDDYNPDQADDDEDDVGNVCDNCPEDGNPNQADGDGDEVGNVCDNCPDHANADQADCDEDGVGDVCAIDQGLSEDCQSNGVPDECDITDGTSQDCNETGIPDECELGDHDCCDYPHEPGCSDAAISECVCAIDPYCCDVEWDRLCVKLVTESGCGDCPADNDCNDNGIPDECDSESTDVALFVSQLLAESPDPILVCMFDQNGDGILNGIDIQPFVIGLVSP